MQQRSTPNSDRPQPEPEIYPPGSAIPNERIWVTTGTRGTRRIYVAKLGPVGITLLTLLIGVLSVVALFVLLGATLILAAVAVVLAVGAILSTVLRGRFRV